MSSKKELWYFQIGSSYGGNQRWMRDWWMHVGGCGALTMCDALIYFALRKDRRELYPYNAEKLTKKHYRKFAMSVKPYLRPRETGIKDIHTYMDGAKIYLEDIEAEGIAVRGLEGCHSYEEVAAAITAQIDREDPVSYLMLKHQDKKFSFFEWHWFLVTGYERRGEALFIKVATYGKAHWLPLRELWDTGFEEKGGIVFFDMA